MTPIKTALQTELSNWANNALITDLIQKYYNYTGTVLVVWLKGRKLMLSVSWQYTISNVMNNDCPGSNIGDIITEYIGKVDKTKPEYLTFLLDEDFNNLV
jgi:hypothetical protein